LSQVGKGEVSQLHLAATQIPFVSCPGVQLSLLLSEVKANLHFCTVLEGIILQNKVVRYTFPEIDISIAMCGKTIQESNAI
jgi:hypothetical protein